MDSAKDFRIKFTTEPWCESDGESDGIDHFDGTIFEAAERGPKMGTISLYRIDRSRTIFTACDDGNTLGEMFEAVLRYENPAEFSDGLQKLYGDEAPMVDVLFIEEITLKPKYRGKNIGHLAVQTMIRTFRSGSGLVVLKPFPVIETETPYSINRAREEDLGVEKLRRYWSKMGFEQIPGTNMLAMNLDLPQPWEDLHLAVSSPPRHQSRVRLTQ
jgi:hypothetical protein